MSLVMRNTLQEMCRCAKPHEWPLRRAARRDWRTSAVQIIVVAVGSRAEGTVPLKGTQPFAQRHRNAGRFSRKEKGLRPL
jgi:hypothetical protein